MSKESSPSLSYPESERTQEQFESRLAELNNLSVWQRPDAEPTADSTVAPTENAQEQPYQLQQANAAIQETIPYPLDTDEVSQEASEISKQEQDRAFTELWQYLRGSSEQSVTPENTHSPVMQETTHSTFNAIAKFDDDRHAEKLALEKADSGKLLKKIMGSNAMRYVTDPYYGNGALPRAIKNRTPRAKEALANGVQKTAEKIADKKDSAKEKIVSTKEIIANRKEQGKSAAVNKVKRIKDKLQLRLRARRLSKARGKLEAAEDKAYAMNERFDQQHTADTETDTIISDVSDKVKPKRDAVKRFGRAAARKANDARHFTNGVVDYVTFPAFNAVRAGSANVRAHKR